MALATRKDVAKRAGVSDATVSYVINNTKNVTPEVRERVLAAVKELDYRPNLVARGLATNRTHHVAMLVDNLKNPYYCEVLEGAQHVASRQGYIVSVISLSITDEQTIAELASRNVDGVIFANVGGAADADLKKKIPWISLEGPIGLNYRKAVFDMVECLAGLGHRQIAFLSGLTLNLADNARYRDYIDALEQFGLSFNPLLCVDNPKQRTDEKAGKLAVEELFSRKIPFTAVFAVNDLMAIGAAKGIRDAGLVVPEDISLVGCDNLSILEWYSPSLSTIDVQAFEVGQMMMEQLLAKISGKPDITKKIEATFLPRESIGKPPEK